MKKHTKSQCRYLRTKRAYFPDLSQTESWREGNSTTSQYWCLCTMSTAGPDSGLVAPEKCQRSRRCYKEVELL